MHGREKVNSADSPISRMFGGKSRLTIRALSHPDTVIIEAWKSLKLNIQVRFTSILFLHSCPGG